MKLRLAALAALLAAGCSAPEIRPAVLTPLAARGVYSEIAVEPPEVSSRETDASARARNEQWSAALTESLQKTLAQRGKRIGPDGRYAVVSRMRIVYKGQRGRIGDEVRSEPGSVELQLVLQDGMLHEAAYSTLTKTAIAPSALASWMGLGPDPDETIRRTIDTAVADFVSRL